MKECPHCGLEITDEATSCPHCGRELDAARTPAPALHHAPERQGSNRWLKFFGITAGVFVLACAAVLVAAVAIMRNPGLLYFGPRATITLAPNAALAQMPDPAGLEQDAQILTERARGVGSSITFRATQDGRIVGEGPATEINEELAHLAVSPGLLELVDFGAEPVAEGTQINTDHDYPYFPTVSGKRWHTVMTNAEFNSVFVQAGQLEGSYQIAFTLTQDGTKVLAAFTANNIGRYLGIVVDRKVISCPIIRSTITDGQGVIEGGFSKESAQALAAILRVKGPLPVPLQVLDISMSTPAP